VKKSVLRSLTISALSLAGSTAFAQENKSTVENKEQKVALDAAGTTGGTSFSQDQIDALKKEMEKKDVTENKVTFAGIIQLNANTSDSQRVSTPDFTAGKVRLGVNVSGGIASGQVEVQLRGNQPATQTVASDTATTTNGVTTQTTSGDKVNGAVTIRRAQLNLDVLTVKAGENTFTTTLSLGGIRIGNADATTPDAAWTTTGFGRQDGAYLKEALAFGKKASVEVGFGAFNNIIAYANPGYTTASSGTSGSGYTWDASSSTKQANWEGSSFSQSIGFAGHLAANVNIDDNQSVALKGFFGTQGNSPTNQDSSGGLTQARDVTHVEASLVYNHAGIFGSKGNISGNGFSVYYENENFGKTKDATKNSSGDFNYTNSAEIGDDSHTAYLLGFALAADSSNYLTNMIQKGDRLTYAAAYAMANVNYSSSALSQNYNNGQITASVGYAVNTFETAFNFEYKTSNINSYTDSKGVLNQKNATKTYLTAAYSF
jgi:hypothetical protein